MRLILLGCLYAVILVGSLELQKTELLLGYTLGVLGIVIVTIFTIDHLARKVD